MSTRPPTTCQNCNFSTRHCRQKPGEIPLFVKCCRGWLCAGCRKLKQCVKPSEPDAETLARLELWQAIPPNDGWYSSVPDLVYHSDRASLSSSGARILAQPGGPAKFKQAQDDPPEPKREYDFGHAAHKMVLGEGAQLAVLDLAVHGLTKDGKPAANPKATAAWKQAEKDARDRGRTPITKDQMAIAQQMAGKVFTHPLAAKLLQDGVAEYSGYWHDDSTGVRLRFRPDWVTAPGQGRMICVDYKSAKSADPEQFRRHAAEYGYHCQRAWYLDGLREVGVSDDAAFLFIAQEKTPPYLVSVVQLDAEALEVGRRLNRKAIDLYAKCHANNHWPGYDNTIHTISLPPWAINREETQHVA